MNNRSNKLPLTKSAAQQKYDRARNNLLAMILLTLLNLVLLVLETDSMFLFSASVPYILMVLGIYSEFLPLLVFCAVIAAIAMVLYFLCWLLSKKRPGWMIVALVLFILDTVLMVAFYFPFQGASALSAALPKTFRPFAEPVQMPDAVSSAMFSAPPTEAVPCEAVLTDAATL